MKKRSLPQALAFSTLLALLTSCSDGSSANVDSVNASYSATDPQVEATGTDSGDAVNMEVFDVHSAVVELQ